MQKRIRELAEGRIECAKPVIEFSVSRIELEVPEGEDVSGEFTVASQNQVPVRGIVYSSNPRMECKTVGFEGEEVRIQYLFHSAGLVEGNIQKGEFTVVCSQGEYSLSFLVVMTRVYPASQTGQVRNVSAFAKLAKGSWQEAKRLFYSQAFSSLFGAKEEKERLAYEGIASGQKTDLGLEEFLLACSLKEPVAIVASQTEFTFSQITEKRKEDITLTKNTWGYVELNITSDASFLEVPKRWMSTDDFLGSEAKASFYINPANMHAGKNFGRITIKSVRQEITIPVCAICSGKGVQKVAREIKEARIKLLQSYIAYRLKQTVTGKWAQETLKLLDDLIVRQPGNVWYRLLKAQTFWLNRQRQEAEWILNEFKRKWKDKKSPQWGYYLYICTLMDRDEPYINRLTDEIEQIYLENQEDPVLFWCLLFLREDYSQNRYQRLKAIEARVMDRVNSPVLYVEAYALYLAEPYLLGRFGGFEEKVLNWAKKHEALTKEIAEQVKQVFPDRIMYRERTLLLLEECYGILGDDEMLKVICEYLIRSQIYGKRYFSWYALGVEKKLRITGLYEAYLMSMDARGVQEVPQIIQMYFKYNNQLSYRLKAVLYVNIIASKAKRPSVYEQHYKGMEKFAYGQMSLGHVDDNLAVVYEDVLSHGIYFPEAADAAGSVLFVHRLTCFDPHAAKVIILQDVLKSPIVVSILNGEAYFPIYSNCYSILVEDSYGNRYSSGIPYQLEKLMYPGRHLRACMRKSPSTLPCLLYYFSNRKAQELFEEQDLPYFYAFMASDKVNPVYKAALFPKLFCLLYVLDRPLDMKKELKQVDFSYMKPKDRGFVLEICIEKQLYEQAYQIAEAYGLEPIAAALRVRLLNSRIQQLEFAENELLVKYCADTFLAGKYNDAMLEYLCRYYQGPIRHMVEVFKCAHGFYISTQELAERILVQMMYTDGFVDCVDSVYQSYEMAGSPLLKKAYMTYFSHHSFVGGMLLPEGFYKALRDFWKDGYRVDAICELELLKYYSMHSDIRAKEEYIAEALLKKYMFQGIYFAFYKNLGKQLVQKYQLYDKSFIEYHSQKHSRVRLHSIRVGQIGETQDKPAIGEHKEDTGAVYTMEDMAESYDGIFVKKVVLFRGEALQYYISEETDGKEEMAESGMLSYQPMQGSTPEGRYEKLNGIIKQKAQGHMDSFRAKMLEYEQLDNAAERLFTII